MTPFALIMLVLVIVVVGSLAYWLITKFLDPSWHRVALGIVGVLLLLVLLSQVWPGFNDYRMWR